MTSGARHAQASPPSITADCGRAAGATSRQAVSAQRPATRGAGPAPAAAAQPLGSSGGDADRTTGRIPRLARQLTGHLEGSRLAEKLEAIAELDLAELQAVESPRGYGRD